MNDFIVKRTLAAQHRCIAYIYVHIDKYIKFHASVCVCAHVLLYSLGQDLDACCTSIAE